MKFSFAKVTNSRLMGTMGLIIGWEDKNERQVQYFLLDGEGLGLEDYVSLKNPTKDEMHREEDRLMGGLGADRIRISKDESLFLVKYFYYNFIFYVFDEKSLTYSGFFRGVGQGVDLLIEANNMYILYNSVGEYTFYTNDKNYENKLELFNKYDKEFFTEKCNIIIKEI